MREQTCCFTGHRYIPAEALPGLSLALEQTLHLLIAEGIQYFDAGGALGFDTLAAETVLRLRTQYPHIQLILILPCQNQTSKWKSADVARYDAIKAQADKVVYTGEWYTPGCMHRRNRHMVDDSGVCVAYCTRSTGGSAYTVNYAKRQGLRIIMLGQN